MRVSRRGGAGPFLVLVGLLAACPFGSAAAASDFRVGGNLRSFGAVLDNYDFEPFFGDDRADALGQTLLRLTLDGPTPHGGRVELHVVQSFDISTSDGASGNPSFGLVAGETRYRAVDATTDWLEERNRRATLWADRANVRVRAGPFDVTIGRQAITFGKAFFWNPLDVFLAFDPRQFDQEYKPGVDALRVDVALGPFSGLTTVAAAGRTLDVFGRRASDGPTWFGSAVLGRGFTTWRGFDLALQGGKVYGGYHVGGGATGEAGPLATRLEVAGRIASGSPALLPGVFPERESLVEDAFFAVAGVGHRFPSSLDLEAEIFHNGAGDGEALDASLVRFAGGGTLDLGEHLLGLVASYEILPIVTGYLATIVNLEDPSAQFQPRLRWSAADEIEILGGAILHLGERPTGGDPLRPGLRSEFGSFPDVWWIEGKLYF